MYYIEKNYFTYNSISVALADLMLTIYQIWKMSLNIEIYFKQQNCSKMQPMSIIRNNTIPEHNHLTCCFPCAHLHLVFHSVRI